LGLCSGGGSCSFGCYVTMEVGLGAYLWAPGRPWIVEAKWPIDVGEMRLPALIDKPVPLVEFLAYLKLKRRICDIKQTERPESDWRMFLTGHVTPSVLWKATAHSYLVFSVYVSSFVHARLLCFYHYK
jgi:hypothetical protein